MARPPQFDPDVAVQQALELFWDRGYAATSVSDLVAHLGIGRASLYGAFGSKHALYLRALRRYVATRQPDPVEMLSQPGPAVPAIQALIRHHVDACTGDDAQRGCLLVNAAAELTPSDEQVTRIVENAWYAVETALHSALVRARAQGEISADADVHALARFLLVFIQGLRVVGKATDDADRLREAADHALALIHGHSTGTDRGGAPESIGPAQSRVCPGS